MNENKKDGWGCGTVILIIIVFLIFLGNILKYAGCDSGSERTEYCPMCHEEYKDGTDNYRYIKKYGYCKDCLDMTGRVLED